MISSYYCQEELEKFTTVEDKQLNDLLQEIRNKISVHFYLQTITRTERPLFRKPKVFVYYQMLLSHTKRDLDTVQEVQIINFCQDHAWSINTIVTKSYVVTFFLGMLCEFHRK